MQGSTGFQKKKKPKSHIKIPGAGWVICSRLRTEDPKISRVTAENYVARVTWHPGFVHRCTNKP